MLEATLVDLGAIAARHEAAQAAAAAIEDDEDTGPVPLFTDEAAKALKVLIADMSGAEACTADPEMWFAPEGEEDTSLAKALCRRCDFVHECSQYALRHATDGVWGATTETEREEIREVLGIPSPRLRLRDYVEQPTQAA